MIFRKVLSSVNDINRQMLSYRPEIDGLRAIAVVSVIFYHAQLVIFDRDWFEGGFIGVDIFFVISGYLISRIIFAELETTGSFSFLKFYERRARRILPVLFLVILVSIPYAWRALLPSDFVEYAKSILATLAFGSNFFFYFSTTEYGASSSLLKPFLHTWSLGVEEQFYIVFPLIAIVGFRFLKRHLFSLIFGLSLLSITFAEVMEAANPDLNFYLPFSRFWELAVGSMLAFGGRYSALSDGGLAFKVLPLLGLCLVVCSILFFDGAYPHPGFLTVIPIIGVSLIIGFASQEELVGKLLGSRAFVWVGLVSYSAYLWHFPIFAFSRLEGDLNNFDKLGAIAVTFCLSALSFSSLEKPFRSQNFISTRLFLISISTAAALLAALTLYSIISGGLKFRYPPIVQETDFGEKPWFQLKDSLTGESCHNLRRSCVFSSEDSATRHKVAIIGDSDAAAMGMTLVPMLKAASYDVLISSHGACPFYIGGDIFWKRKKAYQLKGCGQDFQRARLEEVRNFSPDVILHIGRLQRLSAGSAVIRYSGSELETKEMPAFQQLIANGQRELVGIAPTVYVQAFPKTKDPAPIQHVKTLLEGLKSVKEIKKALSDNPYFFKPSAEETEQWMLIEQTLGSSNIFKTWEYICDLSETGLCSGFDSSGVYYFDNAHPSEYVVNFFANDLIGLIEDRAAVD